MARTKRIDPPSFAADGRLPYDELINADDDFDYKYVNPNDEATGVAMYEARGWEVCTAEKDGVRSALGRKSKDGNTIMSLGQVLMRRSKAEGKAEFAAGQGVADAIDRRILKDAAGGLNREGLGRNVSIGVDRSVSSEPFHELE